jgi:uncharacterized RDD family membrane protein YckC
LAQATQRGMVVLTPEHVQIRLVPAGLGSRFIALTVDFLFIVGIVQILSMLLQGFFGTIGVAASIASMFLIMWGYHIYFEVRHHGRTFGKRAVGLRVVDRRGLPITLQQSFIRNIVRALDSAPLAYALGGMVSLHDAYGRRLGDFAADTLVIQERQPMAYKGQFTESRKYNSLRTPQVTRLIRHRISLEEREFLLTLCLRADRLNDKMRYDLMEEVGEHYRKKLEIEDEHLSGENLVRALTAVLYDREA